MSNVITEQMTQAGQQIEHDSFAIVDNEAGASWETIAMREWQIVRRMIHATADFEFNGLAQFHPDCVSAGLSAISSGASDCRRCGNDLRGAIETPAIAFWGRASSFYF